MGGWITPDAPLPTDTICRILRIPNDLQLRAAVNGALLELAYNTNWQEIGTATAQDTADLMWGMVNDFFLQTWDACMIGAIVALATPSIPANMLPCDGSTYNRVDYPDLYAALAFDFIIDADTFITPDLNEYFIYGDPDYNAFNTVGGETDHLLTTAEMPSHNHTDLGHAHGYIPAVPNVTTIGAGAPQPTAVPGASVTATGAASIQFAGGGNVHNNMPPFRRLPYAIIAK